MTKATYPDDTKDHEWARVEDSDGGKLVTVGITRFADPEELNLLMGSEVYRAFLHEQGQ